MLKKLFGIKEKKERNTSQTLDLKQLRLDAENYYRVKDFYCSESVVKVIIDYFNPPFSDEVIKLASGFPVGIGGAMCTCGAVNGGVMAIGMFFGRSEAKNNDVKKTMELSKELYDNFTGKHKVACCKVLIAGKKLGSNEHLKHCINMTGEVAELTARILARELGYKIIE